MDADTRRGGMQEFIDTHGYVRLAELSDAFDVSAITVHRDLDFLASLGGIERVRGGARSTAAPRHEIRTDFNLRRLQMAEAKVAIARRALEELPERSTIFLDASTTVLALASEIAATPGRGLNVVTNAPAIAYQFQDPSTHVLMIPGDVNQSLRAVTGSWSTDFLRNLHIDIAFVSAAGVTTHGGLMTTQRALAEVTEAAFDRSDRHIALLDSTKFDMSALISMAPLDAVDAIITDEGLNEEARGRYNAAGLKIIVAGREPDNEERQEV